MIEFGPAVDYPQKSKGKLNAKFSTPNLTSRNNVI